MKQKFLQSIIVSRKFLLGIVLLQVFSVTALFAQHTVTGHVNSSDVEPGMPGVNIILKGTTVGTVTDANGNYKIDMPVSDGILIFSSIGYLTEEVPVQGKTVVDLKLELDITQLSEIVVVGYGTVKKSDVTGALSHIDEATLRERPTQNVLQALQGKAAGLNVSSNNKPGELPIVTIRGNRSLQASNSPLYVVDGIPLIGPTDQNTNANDRNDTPPNLNDINPNDIASIEVLKDASATAIYGSRGANGVILITTKKGTKGKVSVNYNATVSVDKYRSLTDWMDGGQYVDRWRLALINGRQYNTTLTGNADLKVAPKSWYPDPALDRTRMGLASDPVALASVMAGYEWEADGVTVKTRETTQAEQDMGWPAQVPVYNSANIKSFDWLDAATRQGVTNNHQFSISSGTETSRIYLSLSYFNQTGVQRDQDYRRYNAYISGDITPNKWLTLGTSFNTAFGLQNFGIQPPNTSNTGAKDLYSRASTQFPYAFPTDASGNWIRNAGGNLNLWNPLIDIDQSINERKTTSLIGNMFGEVKFTPWLKYRLNFGTQYRDLRTAAWTGPLATTYLGNRPNTANYNNSEIFSWLAENLLYFDKKIGDAHTIGVTLLQSAQRFRREGIATSASTMVYSSSEWYDIGANSNGKPDGYSTNFTENSLMSFMGRINYSFKDKYLLTASYRRDGASVLAPGHKWDQFPSFAFAWKLHEESFIKNISWIDELKPRVGYGVVGNSSVNPYSSTGPLSRNAYVFGSAPAVGFLPQQVKNPLLRWEKSATVNVGLDFSVLKSRITGSVELYNTITSDLIITKTLPGTSGYVEKLQNIGKTENKGIEITLSPLLIDKPDFSWTMDLNWSANREKILELINGKQDMLAQRYFIGQPLQVYYQYQTAGIWQNTPEDLAEMAKYPAGSNFYPGTIKIVDQPTVDSDGDGVNDTGDYRITADDYVIRGSNRPKWIGGVTNTFKYKNWTLSSFIYARVGQTYFGGFPGALNGGVNPSGRVENDIWSFDNPTGRWPMPTTANANNIVSGMQFIDGTFYTVRNISLSYAIPNDWLEKISVKDVQLSVQVLNPFIWGGDAVKLGLNPDDNTNWDNVSQANTNTANPLGGMNNNTILPQSFVFGLRAGF